MSAAVLSADAGVCDMKRRILLVDDDANVRAMLALLLDEIGCDVTQAADGPEALRTAEMRPWDLLVTDLNLGSAIDGEDVAREMSATRPQLPVLYVSSDCSGFRGEVGPHQRMLQKPVGARRFADTVNELLDAADNNVSNDIYSQR